MLKPFPAARVNNPAFDLLLKGLINDEVPLIDVESLLNSQEEFLLLDTRSKEEFQISHIPSATWVGYEEFDSTLVENIPRHQKILLYCSVGYRSGKIALSLQKTGFEEVYNLYGGIFEWNNQGQKIVDMQNRESQKLHVYNKFWGIWSNATEKIYSP